jgi:hypothetical protein
MLTKKALNTSSIRKGAGLKNRIVPKIYKIVVVGV